MWTCVIMESRHHGNIGKQTQEVKLLPQVTDLSKRPTLMAILASWFLSSEDSMKINHFSSVISFLLHFSNRETHLPLCAGIHWTKLWQDGLWGLLSERRDLQRDCWEPAFLPLPAWTHGGQMPGLWVRAAPGSMHECLHEEASLLPVLYLLHDLSPSHPIFQFQPLSHLNSNNSLHCSSSFS